AEDGIRCFHVTGVQTCALPISQVEMRLAQPLRLGPVDAMPYTFLGETVADIVGVLAAAESVDHHPHLHTARLGALERVDDLQAGFVEIEDVGFEVDRQLGRVDGLDERREVLAAVTQQAYGIALAPPEFKARRHERDPLPRESSWQLQFREERRVIGNLSPGGTMKQ